MNIFVSPPDDTEDLVFADSAKTFRSSEDFALEIAELELTLGMRSTDGGFEQAVRSAAVSTGNDFLFAFPAAGFAVTASDVACLRVRSVHGETYVYVYRAHAAAPLIVATGEDIGHHYLEFARAYTDMAGLLLDA